MAKKECSMKKRHGLFFGFAVLALAAIFTLAGCDNLAGGDDGGNSGVNSGNNSGNNDNNGLSSSTTYYYRVSAYNSAGESAQSSYVSATTQSSSSGGGTSTRPGNVSSGSVTILSSTSLSLTWGAVSGATSYNIYRSNSATAPSTPTFTASGGNTNSYNDTGLTMGRG
jgi:cellulose 1,4-beta-cellobiosidase